MIKVEFNVSRLANALRNAPDAIGAGARNGLQDVLNEWRVESVNKAPIDTSTLRRNIKTELEENSILNLSGKISANAYNGTYGGQRFNYAYYIHEVKGESFRGRQPGTIGKFLDQPANQNKDRWVAHIESEIQAELKRKGW